MPPWSHILGLCRLTSFTLLLADMAWTCPRFLKSQTDGTQELGYPERCNLSTFQPFICNGQVVSAVAAEHSAVVFRSEVLRSSWPLPRARSQAGKPSCDPPSLVEAGRSRAARSFRTLEGRSTC